MKTDNGPDGPTGADTYATRAPGAQSLEALAMAAEGVERVQGVGLEEFRRGLLDCGFLDAEEFRAILAEIAPDERCSEAENLARALVKLGKLTRYQAAALYQGKGKALLIGPYVVLGKLGSGGMGMVFKARARDGGPIVALKVLPPSASKHAHSVLRFRREASILASLDHPNLVSSHGIGAFGGVHYLIMDYVEGSDLGRVVRSGGPLKVGRAVDCVIQAARGLAAAHERGIVHRDVKPANLLIDAEGVVRVLDLGLARITQSDETIESGASSPSLTASGIIMGTVDFLPPEQSDDSKRADHRSDIYSLGCTLHFLLTGRPPYSGETLMQKLLAHHRKPIPSLVEARPDVPAEVDAIFRAMLAKAPEDRPQSMQEVLERLEAWRTSKGGSKSLRVFGDSGASSKTEAKDRTPTAEPKLEDRETYDLLTFVRDELLEPDFDPETTVEDPRRIPSRKPKKSKNIRRIVDIALRCLVAAAAIVVLIRFFPKLPDLPAASKATQTTPKPETPAVTEALTPKTEPNAPKAEAPAPKSGPEQASGPRPKAVEPASAVPSDDRSRPPSPDPSIGPPPPPPPPEGWPPPPRRPGEGPPPRRPGDGPPPRRPGEGPARPGEGPPPRPPAGGTIPF